MCMCMRHKVGASHLYTDLHRPLVTGHCKPLQSIAQNGASVSVGAPAYPPPAGYPPAPYGAPPAGYPGAGGMQR